MQCCGFAAFDYCGFAGFDYCGFAAFRAERLCLSGVG
jgi:hypothetical protein